MPRLSSLTLNDIDQMDGLDFERLVAELLRDQGYRAEVTQASGDFGVDVIARKGRHRYAIQVKRYKGSVPRTAVSDAVAGKYHWNCDKAWVVTSGHFTKDARTLADSTDCRLTDREDIKRWLEERGTLKVSAIRWRPVLLWGALLLFFAGSTFFAWPYVGDFFANRGAPLTDPPIVSDTGSYTVECVQVDENTVRCTAQ